MDIQKTKYGSYDRENELANKKALLLSVDDTIPEDMTDHSMGW
jgi:hypothetical protein